VRVAHVDPVGWFCEISAAEPALLDDALGALITGLDRAAARAPEGGAAVAAQERRGVQRREGERRRQVSPVVADLRARHDRRLGDRRFDLRP
jgi:hypothetical protein